MNDRELLTYAAKAIDLKWLSYHHSKGLCCRDDKYGGLIEYYWNPLEDDGDAFRLMVKLLLAVEVGHIDTEVFYRDDRKYKKTSCANATDKESATRRAIVMAAAEIGKGM